SPFWLSPPPGFGVSSTGFGISSAGLDLTFTCTSCDVVRRLLLSVATAVMVCVPKGILFHVYVHGDLLDEPNSLPLLKNSTFSIWPSLAEASALMAKVAPSICSLLLLGEVNTTLGASLGTSATLSLVFNKTMDE